MSTDALRSAVTVFLLSLASAIALYRALYGVARTRVNRLLEPSYHRSDYGATTLQGPIGESHLKATWLQAMTRRLGQPSMPSQRQTALRLGHAGFYGTDKLVVFRITRLTSMVGCGFAGFGLGALYGGLAVQIAAFLGVLGYLLPMRILRRMGRTRQLRISHELPAALDLLTVCLEAGLALPESIRLIARRAERRGAALGIDLGIVTGELSAGLSLGDALRNLADRSGSEDLKSVLALLIQSDRMGTRLGPALRACAEQLATRRRMRAEEKAQKAAIKMLVPLVTLILPAMLIVVLGPAFLKIVAVVSK